MFNETAHTVYAWSCFVPYLARWVLKNTPIFQIGKLTPRKLIEAPAPTCPTVHFLGGLFLEADIQATPWAGRQCLASLEGCDLGGEGEWHVGGWPRVQ